MCRRAADSGGETLPRLPSIFGGPSGHVRGCRPGDGRSSRSISSDGHRAQMGERDRGLKSYTDLRREEHRILIRSEVRRAERCVVLEVGNPIDVVRKGSGGGVPETTSPCPSPVESPRRRGRTRRDAARNKNRDHGWRSAPRSPCELEPIAVSMREWYHCPNARIRFG